MRDLKSVTGRLFAALYAIAFVAAYVYYRNHVGEWFPPADFGLILVALPFVLTMRFLAGGSFDMGGEDTLKLAGAPRYFAARSPGSPAACWNGSRARGFRALRGRV